jgi:hypothetical protein
MKTNRVLALIIVCLSGLLGGCSASLLGVLGPSIETNKTIAKPPGDVIVYVSVEDSGTPVGYLSADNFEIYENDVRLNHKEIELRMLPRNSVAAGHTVLLLDLSGSPDEKELNRINRGAAHFVEKVSTTQSVTVVAFDGSERAREVGRFTRVETSTQRPLPNLAPFLSKDTSRDLHSALLAAIKGLAASLGAQPGEVHYGTVVTLVRGPDLAGRKTVKEVQKAISDSGYEFYSIAPEELKFELMGSIGKDERFTYATIDPLPMRFQDLGMRVRSAWQSHYLISYCTPARAGIRKLKVKVTYESKEGSRRTASTKSEFDATGFQAGCKPAAPTGAGTSAGPPDPEQAAGSGASSGNSPDSNAERAPDTDARSQSDDHVVPPPSTGKYE